ncbi:MAG: NAD(P)-dependent oxidoreductase [Chitinophaga sp.]|uniref:NAD(P)-dependent oxidoreductase n=1 Tax=Chitinophaga sp. TaxID=1869181 RepID=UPI001B0C3CB3|nr:NAD(P)-binding domain-containing protein [Chitinophaga sp.]MBO9730266.1 NAD(P)-dependent oxidoreductase [Chitinophaga sp.]
MESSKKVTVIGLGDMGTVLASTLLKHGYKVTIWNRTAAKAAPLIAEGAIFIPDVATAIAASPVMITCVTNYDKTRSILGSPAVAPVLAGKVQIELSSGTPKNARDSAIWARERNMDYIDGAILATPSQIGRPDTPIFVSGSKPAYEQHEHILKALAGGLQYMGEEAGAAATWDMGFLSTLFGMTTGFFHGAQIFQSEGIPIAALGAMIAHTAPVLGEMIKRQADVIQAGDYSNPESSLNICADGVQYFVQQAKDAGINAEIPSFILGLFKRAQAAGYGNEQLASVFKILK